jgi:formylglycine-generating enzyme required for sulfatase activity
MPAAVVQPSERGKIAHPLCHGGAPVWASEWGEDAQFGPFAILELPRRGGGKPVRQRWRWIPRGSFQMGSPDDEPGRWDDEGPRHWVTLTRGYWMMDTPCTQALWEAVLTDEENPSYFQDADRPVEQVSWEDVQRFVGRLNGLIPGLDCGLPTESQWEYACRAGSETALYRTAGASGAIKILGANNAPALDSIAWYGGNSGVEFDLDDGWDSEDWDEKQYPHVKAGTRKVSGKAANGWGLYDMLGNVWEWCADSKRAYGEDLVVDPVGASFESRAIRGGSWDSHARGVRCAYRDQYSLRYSRNYLGFRLVRVQDQR